MCRLHHHLHPHCLFLDPYLYPPYGLPVYTSPPLSPHPAGTDAKPRVIELARLTEVRRRKTKVNSGFLRPISTHRSITSFVPVPTCSIYPARYTGFASNGFTGSEACSPARLPQSGADYSVKVNFAAALYVISVCQFVKVIVNVKVEIINHEP